ncbi:MAG TPA: glycosyltransferase [Candidatus Saccharimonadales bacterium]|nr:glycosyltransferase [Candidatus Saccharimonadales bacterium]
MKKVLWISGRLPTPLFSGDALYSAGILKALAMTGEITLSVVGTRRSDQAIDGGILGLPGITCVDVPPSQPSGLRSLLSSLPRDAYNLGTHELELALARLLKQDWDWIVVDHAYSAGLLPIVLRSQKDASICYIAHNAEGKIRPEIASSISNPLRRTIMGLDAEKYRKLEQKILKVADAVICITDADESYFRQFAKKTYVVPPIFLGATAPARVIDPNYPRAVLLLGSFEWVAKQQNLELIIDALLPSFKQNGISLNVVGTVPQTIRDRHADQSPHLIFHGRVADISGLLLSSRGGLVPDLLGGGFKLKVMDYAFERLPIFGLRMALAGTTPEEQSAMFLADSIEELAKIIVENIDNFDRLNRNPAKLLELFSERFGLERGLDRVRQIFLRAD